MGSGCSQGKEDFEPSRFSKPDISREGSQESRAMQQVQSKDQVLRNHYAQIDDAVDEIVGDPEILAKLLERVNMDLPPSHHFTQKEISKRLFTLRKRGEDNGGLVRKHRQFNGRNNKPR